MYKKIAFAAAGLVLLASPLFVAAQQVQIPALPANPTISDLQNEVQLLIQILTQLLAARSHPSSATLSVAPLSGRTIQLVYSDTRQGKTYIADLGDGNTAPLSFDAGACHAGGCYDTTYTYVADGSYTINLRTPTASNFQTVASATVTINDSDTSGTVTISVNQQVPNSLAPQGAIVPFTKFTLTNTSNAAVTIQSIVVQHTGVTWRTDGALTQVYVADDSGASLGGSSRADQQGTTIFDSNHQINIPITLTLNPGDSKNLTVVGGMSSNLSAYNGQTSSLSVIGIGTSGGVNGSLPVTGATHTFNSTLVVCPETAQLFATYGYHCTTTANSTGGTLTVSTDASSPSYQIVAGGTTGVVAAVYKFHAAGEAIQLNKVGLLLASSATSGDVTQAYLYDGSTLIGRAFFTGTSGLTIATLPTPVVIPQDSDKTITIKVDTSSIGIGASGTAGDLIAIWPDVSGRTQATGMNTGALITASTNGLKDTPGVRIFRSYPIVSLDALNSTNVDFSSGKQPALLRFRVTAAASGSIGLGIIPVQVSASGVTFGSVAAYAYTDPNYSQPIPGTIGGALVTVNPSGGLTGSFGIPLSNNGGPIEIPAGQTYYFQIIGNNSNVTGSNAVVTTSLSSDTTYIGIGSYNANTTRFNGNINFIWSPNDNTTSQFSDADWTNGYGVAGLGSLASGISQTRTGTGSGPLPDFQHCPLFQQIACSAGYTSVSGGTDSNGCQLASQCVATTPTSNPTSVTPKVITLTAGSSWTVPSDWNNSNNTIEVIGAGGGGGGGGSGGGGGHGGGGGAYAKISNLTLSGSVSYNVGSGGGGGTGNVNGTNGADTWFNGSGSSCAGQSVCAKGGAGGTWGAHGTGLGGDSGASIGSTKYSGGNGGNEPGNTASGASGGSAASSSGGGSESAGAAGGVAGSNGSAGSGYGTGGGAGGATAGIGGNGAQGEIIITYTPMTTASAGNPNLANALTALQSALQALLAKLK